MAPIGSKLPGISVGLVTRTVVQAPSPSAAAEALEGLLAKPDLWSGMAASTGPAGKTPPIAPQAPASADQLRDRAEVLERRLQSTLRALRKEDGGRASPAAVRVLGQDALRLLVEVMGTRRLASLVDAGGSQAGSAQKGPLALRTRGDAGTAAMLQGALSSTQPDRHRAIVSLLLSSADAEGGKKGAAQKLDAHEQRALADILGSLDPSHGSFVREKLANGASLEEVRHLLAERLVPVTLDAPAAASADKTGEPAKVEGLKFDLGLNKWVQNDRSWRYEVRLAQMFEYVIDGIIDGREELKARLLASSIDPATGESAVNDETVARFVDDLHSALLSDSPVVRKLLDQRFDMIFSTTDGGDSPVAALWELPVRATADLFAAMTDPPTSDALHAVAEDARAADKKRIDDIRGPLAGLLEKYDGVPRRHKRAHAALINMGLAGQSVGEMGREGGVLPRSKTLLDANILKDRYADTENLKMRFLITSELEMIVLSDDDFEAVVKKYGFPPNHELLSYNLPISCSGYVTIDHGRVVGLEDDGVMLKGKLPEGLPPAIEVMRARGFDLDETKIEKSSHVLDFEGFKELAVLGSSGATGDAGLPDAPKGTAAQVREALMTSAHVDRPALAVAVVKEALEAEIAKGADESQARTRVVPFLTEALGGLHIINTSRKDFREGRLPQHLNESSDLHIDASLAEHLVRLVKVGS